MKAMTMMPLEASEHRRSQKISFIFVAFKIRCWKRGDLRCSVGHPSKKEGSIYLKYKCWLELRQFPLISLTSSYYFTRNSVKA